ncbi:hydroxylamine dehydrogenase, partial [Nitrosomonas europaea]
MRIGEWMRGLLLCAGLMMCGVVHADIS